MAVLMVDHLLVAVELADQVVAEPATDLREEPETKEDILLSKATMVEILVHNGEQAVEAEPQLSEIQDQAAVVEPAEMDLHLQLQDHQ